MNTTGRDYQYILYDRWYSVRSFSLIFVFVLFYVIDCFAYSECGTYIRMYDRATLVRVVSYTCFLTVWRLVHVKLIDCYNYYLFIIAALTKG